MSQQLGPLTVHKKAKVNPADGSISLVATVVMTEGNRVVVDDMPITALDNFKANLKALDGKYDYVGM